MQDVRAKYVSPAVDQLAFNCPHCGALAKQFWFTVHVEPMKKDLKPFLLAVDNIKKFNVDHVDHVEEAQEREKLKDWAERMAQGRPFIELGRQSTGYNMYNVSLSQCFGCDDVAMWLYDRLVWPQRGEAVLPNPDLPDDVRRDYDEASTILNLSPRGAAALLRLGIQKLCRHLGEKGKDINADIAVLVKKGLDARVQQALDVVRVIGNNAVHPGLIDLRDDRATAEKLFMLVNLIAEILISHPKHIRAMYDNLPEDARKSIEMRDGRTTL